MKTIATELTVLLAKLNKLTFIVIDGTKLTTKEGFEIDYSHKLYHSTERAIKLPIQFLFRVSYKGKYIYSWGCVEEVDTKALVDFYLTKKRECRAVESNEEDRIESLGKTIFDTL